MQAHHKTVILITFIFFLLSVNTYGWEMYVSNGSSNSITVYDQAGVLIDTITDPSIFQPGGMAFRDNGNLYVACGSSKVIIIDQNRTVIGSINTPLQGAGLAVGGNNHLYVGLSNSPNNVIQEYDENDNFLRSFSGGLNPFKPDVMNIGPNGNLFVVSYGLVEFDLDGNLIEYLPNDSTYSYGLGVVAGPDGLLYVIRHNLVTSEAEMIGLDPSTLNVEKSFSLGGDRWFYGMTLDPGSHHFFTTLFTSNIIEEYAFTGEFLGSFVSGLSGPVDIAIKHTDNGDGILPDTGQTKCYDNSQEITCPNPGDDFYGQDAQYIGNPQSYTKLDEAGNDLPDGAPTWVMVLDNVTGLIWEMKADDGSIHDKDDLFNWYDAQALFIASLNNNYYGGYSDWRLPTPKELSLIIKRNSTSPSIETEYFTNTQPENYWSSITSIGNTNDAWVVHFQLGLMNVDSKQNSYHYVRAVRGGRFSNNFIDNGNGTITDKNTGLMWQQDGSFMGTWENSLSYCENLLLADYDDWRLPNINELLSIADFNRTNPAINTNYFTNTDSSKYWSSGTLYLNSAWTVGFYSGQVWDWNKMDFGHVRAVRGSGIDSDKDRIFDDGDISGLSTDNPCIGGQTQDCDDNCPANVNFNQGDVDGDGAGDICDNCPDLYNPMQDDSDDDGTGDICDNCPNTHNPDQLDFFPPQRNSIGDACECEADFMCDGDVDGADASMFKFHFGRSLILYPCTVMDTCRGDFNCDGDVDGTDASLFKQDFGRSSIQNPCPMCEAGVEWCGY